MARLPARLQPLFPIVKRTHRTLARGVGTIIRSLPGSDDRAVPRMATTSAEATAMAEPASVTFHPGGAAERIHREMPQGTPPRHWFFQDKLDVEIPRRFTLEVRGGRVFGRNAAVITPGGVLDFETSPYFGISDWREHPLYLRPRLPEPVDVDGTLLCLAARGTWGNYYHFMMDALPRLGIVKETMPEAVPDGFFVNATAPYQLELLELLGLSDVPRLDPAHVAGVRATRLLVPSLPNNHTIAPRFATQWLRQHLPVGSVRGLPRRIFITRGDRPNTRRLIDEGHLMERLARRGFVRLDPGQLSVRQQIDHFAAAEVVVAPHGAGLTNLNFCSPGVRVLELFSPTYLNPGFWSVTDNIPDSRYRYVIASRRRTRPPGHPMTGVQDDIRIDADRVMDELDVLLSDPVSIP